MTAFNKLFVASLKEFSRDRTSLSFTVILPVLLVAFFGFAFGSGSQPMKIGVADAPSIGAGGAASSSISVLKRDRNLRVESGSLAMEMSRLRAGDIAAVVVVGHQIRIEYDAGDGAVTLAARTVSRDLLAAGLGPGPGVPDSTESGLVPVSGIANNRLDFVIPGILATAIMWLGIFAAIPLVQQREQQVLRRFAVTPVSRSQVVLAQVGARLLVSLGQAAIILVGARLLFGVPIGIEISSPVVAVLSVGGLVLLGALVFVAIGYAVAALSSTQSNAHAWAQLLTMPMLVLAGVFFPISLMPGVLKPVVAILPLTYLADALRQTAVSGQAFAPVGVDLAALAAWVVVPLLIAVRFFRWS